MSDLFLRPLFTWRSAVCSEHGPKSPLTRLTLLALSLHMSERGDSCFPSMNTLAIESGLSLRSIKEHVVLAAEAGWIGKRARRLSNSQGWRRNEYFTQIPPEVEATLRADPMFHGEQRGAPDAPPQHGAPDAPPAQELSGGGAGGSKGGAPDRKNMVQEAHPSTSKSTSKRTTTGARALPLDFSISDAVKIWAEKQVYTAYLQDHFEWFVDWARGGGKKRLDWDATFRNCVRSDWGQVRKALIAAGKTSPKAPDTSCRADVAGQRCGMPGRPDPVHGYACQHHQQKRIEQSKGAMPDFARAALKPKRAAA